ncbi:acetyl-CoA carboxylase biotin carboxylase subunit family protein [Acidovorax sp. Root217]|uniref:ATP-grasp domain-containing protein n=1 Tax=Acidovorax sp. Root217 TaxID=1736492 RepID=UPI000A4B163C|nr:ATP-grasp domain-containing protein [Acidovorax sp. Root217]
MSLVAQCVFIDPDVRWILTIAKARERGFLTTAVHSALFGTVYPTATRSADRAALAQTDDIESLTEVFCMLLKQGPICAVLVGRDAVIEQVARVCELLGIPFTPTACLDVTRDKVETRKYLQAAGLPNAQYAHAPDVEALHNAVERLGYPCVIKPVKGHASILAFRVRNESELLGAVRKIRLWVKSADPSELWILSRGFICEEWLRGPVISAEICCSPSGHVPVTLAIGTTYRQNICSGYGNIIPFVPDYHLQEACFDYAIAACGAVGATFGMCDVEMVYTTSGPILLEINARKMGGEMVDAYELATKCDFSDILLDAYLGHAARIPCSDGSRSTVIRKVIARRGGTVVGLPTRWLRSLRDRYPNVLFRNYSLVPGRTVRRGQVVARFLVAHHDPKEAFKFADWALERLEKASQIPMIRGKLPTLARRQCNSPNGGEMSTPDPTPVMSPAKKKAKTPTKRAATSPTKKK